MNADKKYYRVRLGKDNDCAQKCFEEGWIGAGYGIKQDLADDLPDNWKEFRQKYLQKYPERDEPSGHACRSLHTMCKGIKQNDIILSPDRSGNCLVGSVISDYCFAQGEGLPHRRKVEWYSKPILKQEMSDPLKKVVATPGTVCDITKHSSEIENLISGGVATKLFSHDETIEDPSVFAMEEHLEDFLVENWSQTELGKSHNIFEEDGEPIGQQFQTDTGRIDILAISKDKKEFLVIELKKGRASDAVVGQILRYMGDIQEDFPEKTVRGCIIAREDDLKLQRALSRVPSIDFYKYEVNFRLRK